MPAPWQGLNWSVAWDGRGVVSKPEQLQKIWNAAFISTKQGWRVGFSFDRGESMAIDISAYYDSLGSIEHLSYLVDQYGGINGVAFEFREEAESFVEAMEKHIAWNLLKREFHE